jgi:nucleotide-binding universal stress UspA family protein
VTERHGAGVGTGALPLLERSDGIGPVGPSESDRVGRARARSVRVFAPSDRDRRRVVRWAARHASRTGACVQVIVDPDERPLVHGHPGGVAGLLRQRLSDLAGPLFPPLRPRPDSLVRDLAGVVAGARLLAVSQSLPQLPVLLDLLSEPVVAVPDLPLPPTDAPVVLALAPWSGPEVVGTAFETAARYGVGLQVVQAVERAEDSDEAARACEDELAVWRLTRPEVDVDLAVVGQNPVDALRRWARNVQLVVMGRPVRGRARALIDPSPASELIRTATCPVLVVPSPGVPRPSWWARPGWGLASWTRPGTA